MTTQATLKSGRSGLEASGAHPMDSSCLFTTLISMVEDAEEQSPPENSSRLISVPTLRKLLSAIHFRDANTLKHSRRVGLISVGIASRLGWEDQDLRVIELSALLHDIGKIGIPDHILRKPGTLSPDEAEYIAVLHRVALALLQACRTNQEVTEIVAQSHGIDAEDSRSSHALGLGARILAVADAYDSLTTQQCFRSPYDRWEALQILEEQSGKQFDRNVVAALGRWLDGPDAALLADERAEEVSIHVNAPVDMETRNNASQLCQLINHLYLLETLYDAFYIVDRQRRISIWSSGAAQSFNRPAATVLGKKWSRQLVCKSSSNTDPIDVVFATGEPVCHPMTIQDGEGVYRDVDVQSLPIFSDQGEVAGVVELICNCKESKRHRGQFRSLQLAATRDPLTNVFNRGELERRMAALHENWLADPERTYSVVFLDLDHFKSINDRFSHLVGDRVLIEVTRLLQDELYSGEVVGRYGGEEFVILCPDAMLETAFERADRLRRSILSTQFTDQEGLHVTASLGVAQAQQDDTVETLIERADKALYDAKRQGRNRTCLLRSESECRGSGKYRQKSRAEWIHTATIVTCAASDMLTLKLSAFVEQNSARILTVTPKHVALQVGGNGLFGTWGRPSEKSPVRVSIDIADAPSEGRPSPVKRLILKTTVEPVGKMTNPEAFRARACQVVEQMRSHLLAD